MTDAIRYIREMSLKTRVVSVLNLLGDDSLWDAPPANNYLPPTQPTTAEKAAAAQNPISAKEPSDSHDWSLNVN